MVGKERKGLEMEGKGKRYGY